MAQTFAVLRSLHSIIGDALNDIQLVYEHHPVGISSSETTPRPTVNPKTPLDFPSLDTVYDPADPAEQLRTHPLVSRAISKVVAAAGQLSTTVQTPFVTLVDAAKSHNLPCCLRLLEASNTVEILREAGPDGLHVDVLSQKTGVNSFRLSHVLRLLATHHFLLERKPQVFALNRLSSMLDSGKSFAELQKYEHEGRPEMKYHNSNGCAALIGLNTDDLLKCSAYMTEAWLLSRADPPIPPFQYAFATNVPFFPWMEGRGVEQTPAQNGTTRLLENGTTQVTKECHGLRHRDGVHVGPGIVGPAAKGLSDHTTVKIPFKGSVDGGELELEHSANPNKYRLERFGSAMKGTGSWEVPGALLNGFDWQALPRGGTIVDVGGGIGSACMILANAFEKSVGDQGMGFQYVIQDRAMVVKMGEEAWQANHPELLRSGQVRFDVHDFFQAQPIKNAAAFLVRIVLHDWADPEAGAILKRLREAATEETKLFISDWVLPLACVDDFSTGDESDSLLADVDGAEKALGEPPLLPNLGKASSLAYYADMTMQTLFNAQERTLRETVKVARDAGWKVTKARRAEGSLFGYVTAVPCEIPHCVNGNTSGEIQNHCVDQSTERKHEPRRDQSVDQALDKITRLTAFKTKVGSLMRRGQAMVSSSAEGNLNTTAELESSSNLASKRDSIPSTRNFFSFSAGKQRLDEPEGEIKRPWSVVGLPVNSVVSLLGSRRLSRSGQHEKPVVREKPRIVTTDVDGTTSVPDEMETGDVMAKVEVPWSG